MLRFSTGLDFENAVFGSHSRGAKLFRRFGRDLVNFGEDVNAFIRSSRIIHPNTPIGTCLYNQVVRLLDRSGMNSEGLVFLPSVDTSIDLYGVDGLFFLPSLFPHLVTIDAFNTDPTKLLQLRESWIDNFNGTEYSNTNFQSDQFLHKKGITEWEKDNKKSVSEGLSLVRPPDFRQYAKAGRWENQFILTPLDVTTYERRRDFARLVAGYFVKVAKCPSYQNKALLSH